MHVLSGYRHELVWFPPKISGHVRAVIWGGIAAGIVWGLGL